MMMEAKKSKEDYFEGRATCSDYGKKQKEWKQLWNIKILSKIKIFYWRLALNSIPIASVLKNKNIVDTPRCKVCGTDEDTREYGTMHCYTLQYLDWAQLDEDITELIANLHISDPKNWIFFMCSNVPKNDRIRILITCWAIWQARRKTIYDGIFQSPSSVMVMIMSWSGART